LQEIVHVLGEDVLTTVIELEAAIDSILAKLLTTIEGLLPTVLGLVAGL
jgi:hypothetical protein